MKLLNIFLGLSLLLQANIWGTNTFLHPETLHLLWYPVLCLFIWHESMVTFFLQDSFSGHHTQFVPDKCRRPLHLLHYLHNDNVFSCVSAFWSHVIILRRVTNSNSLESTQLKQSLCVRHMKECCK